MSEFRDSRERFNDLPKDINFVHNESLLFSTPVLTVLFLCPTDGKLLSVIAK